MKKRTGVLVAGVMVLCAVGTPMMADGQPGVPIDPNPFLALLPALRTAPAPGWVKLGTRLTYESSASSSPGHVQCHEEPNGEWKDDQGRVCPEGSGIGRRGLTQVTVVALDQQVAVLDLQIYALTNGTGPAVTSGYMGGIGVPGAGVDWWLAQSAGLGWSGRAVGTGAESIEAAVSGRRTGVHGRSIPNLGPDRESGLGVRFRHRYTAAHRQRAGCSRRDDTKPKHAARRAHAQRALGPAPGTRLGPPDELLTLRGQYDLLRAGRGPGFGPYPVSFQRQSGGPNWVRYLQQTVQAAPPGMPSPPADGVRITGSGQFGGLCIPPQGLRQLRPGQMLDADPITRMTTSVGQLGGSPRGGEAVTITEINQGQRVDAAYDLASGMLVSISIIDNVLRARTSFQLVGTK